MKVQAVRGMQDILPDLSEKYRLVKDIVRGVLCSYGYREIGLPVIESTQLFQRVIGAGTDVVEKEMYTFEDRNGDSLTLRPEGTAGCVRAAQERGLIYNQTQRLWYCGPMFRHEKPQKGRYRQFESIGAECFGMPGPDIDAEILLMTARIWRELGLEKVISLELNSLGDANSRARHKEALVDFLTGYEDELDEDSKRRLHTNPLRILDSKNERTRKLLHNAPSLSEFLDEDAIVHFKGLRKILDKAGVTYTVNDQIVRGLDYYNRTVFEWITGELGSQGTVCGGGRYDQLIEIIGGKPSPGTGFGIGIDRLALMLMAKEEKEQQVKLKLVDIYIASMGEQAKIEALLLAEALRKDERAYNVVVHCGEGKFKSQMKKADQSDACVALIIGEEEVSRNEVGVKTLRDSAEQVTLSRDNVVNHMRSIIKK